MKINRCIQVRSIGVVTLPLLVFALVTGGDAVARSASSNDRSDNAAEILQKTVLSTGVEIPAEGVPTNEGGHQYTTRMEKRPETISNESAYLKWKWRMNLADPKTGLDNDALRAGLGGDPQTGVPRPEGTSRFL